MIIGGNWNTTDSTVGYAEEIVTRRDALLARLPLDRYARARILGQRSAETVQPKFPKPAPVAAPPVHRPVARYFGLPEIALAAAGAWGTNLEQMRLAGRADAPLRAVFAATALARRYSTMGCGEISRFMGRKNCKSAYEWMVRHTELYRTNPQYAVRFDAAKRALESLK